jgi:hypothetical protein
MISTVNGTFQYRRPLVKKASSIIRKNSKITSWVDGAPEAAGWASGQTSESGSPRPPASPGPAHTAGNSNFTAKTTVNEDDNIEVGLLFVLGQSLSKLRGKV